MIIIIAIAYVIIGAILGTLYHAFEEETDPSYDFEDEGAKTVAFAIFWPIASIIFLTYYTFKSRPKK